MENITAHIETLLPKNTSSYPLATKQTHLQQPIILIKLPLHHEYYVLKS